MGLRLQQIEKKMPDFQLQADFDLAPGERAALMGPSGSGKTTLLRLICGLENFDQGCIMLDGLDISKLPTHRRQIGMVFQDAALFESMNVLENITFALKVRGQSKKQRDALAMPWVEKLGLRHLIDSPVHHLSGGEKQRVGFARALIWKPKLLLLDEPFSSVDSELRKVLRQELLTAHSLWPVVMLLVTHDESDVQAVATSRLELLSEKASSGLSIRRIKRIDQPEGT